MANIRTVDFLPEIFQTPVNKQFLSATLDQLVQEPEFKKSQGYVGRKVGPGVNPSDYYVIEPTANRNNYQLEPGVIQVDSNDSNKIIDAITYPGIVDALQLQGANTTRDDRLFKSDYYAFDPFVDFDKFSNFSQYYWLPSGPNAVDVSATTVPLTDDITVTRANGAYTFSGRAGTNPVLTLVRGGSYNFNVAQNTTESVNFRVTNNGTTSYVIDYQPNPTLILVRGNTYTFDLSLSAPLPFYIKTQVSYGTTNIYNNGVTNNGASVGTITFTVPQDAPDTLYYCNNTQFNLQGQFNIVNANPGTGPGFWIQTDPGVNGRVPATPNISSRDVLGVVNNGEDLGTVTFNVPDSTAQQFYYNLPYVGGTTSPYTVDLVTSLTFEQINNQFVVPFTKQYGGIDGVENLNGRTIVFLNPISDPVDGGWAVNSQFDPLAENPANNGQLGSFDSVDFDQTTYITDTAVQYSIWQINYVTAQGGAQYMTLTSVQTVDNLNKFNVLFGTKYASTSWYKNANGLFQQIPLLTAIKNVLFYQDGTDPEIFGPIYIIDQNLSSTIDINNIIGQKNYTAPNGVKFTNGLKVVFRGDVTPVGYQNNSYYVEGVGTAIQLLPVTNYVTPETYTQSSSVPYDSVGYDIGNYDATLNAPIIPDYLTINRASPDLNAWSRSNRWFHVDVIIASAAYNNTVPVLDNAFRGKRPILEYRAGTKLFDFGTEGKQPVDIIDFTQTNALANVNGSISYVVDGYTFAPGTRVIFAADQDPTVRNKIYVVEFVVPDTVPPLVPEPLINLIPAADSAVLVNQTVVSLSGTTLQGTSYYYDGVEWVSAQQKSSVNQPPLFDVYDSNGVSFGNKVTYPSSTFAGSKLFGYLPGQGSPDNVLGFAISYLTLTNIGDIEFSNYLYTDTFNYTPGAVGRTVNISTGFVREYKDRVNFAKEIGWQTAITPSTQRQQFQFTYNGLPLQLDIPVVSTTVVPPLQIFVNSVFQEPSTYTTIVTSTTTTITLLNTFNTGDIIEVCALSNVTSSNAFYQVPSNLENNPLNGNSTVFTLGTIRNHYNTICQNLMGILGPVNGANNSRDLGNLVPYGQQILQQSSPLTLAGYFMRDPAYNIFLSLDYNSREYIKFKSLLLETVATMDIGTMTVPQILDQAISTIVAGRTKLSPFYWSDMLPTGSAYTSTATKVTPITTAVFNTTQVYDFTTANYLGLLVYVNGVLLVRDTDYVVSVDAPKLTILVPLAVGDVVTINEYPTTVGNFIPNTPTKLGLYPKFKPEVFFDSNYINPTEVIQGHDGSITVAFGDIRDNILLEFESRIYNNLKHDGNPVPLTIDHVQPGFFRKTDYTRTEINSILTESFLSWVGWNKLNYQQQEFIPGNAFTYNYSQAGSKLDGQFRVSNINEQPLPGAWRGIYQYFYDTTSPSTTPWEMLGFSEMPLWWTQRYGPAPYTSDNLVLWGDLEAGYIADPVAPYINPLYVRPGLTNVIPVDSQGQLLPPLNSVVGLNNPATFQKSWTVGDGGPVENTWWTSSSYPFAVMRLLALTRPAEFFSLFADRDLYKYDSELGQYLYNGRYRLSTIRNTGDNAVNTDLEIYGNGKSKASYIDWIVDYNQQLGINSTTALTTDLSNLDVRLCYRMASFCSQQYLTLKAETSSPNSNNSSLVIPVDSYNLIPSYKNQPFGLINYSALIIEQVETGYAVYGYNNTNPYFNILASISSGANRVISAGGTTVSVPTQYSKNIVEIPYGYVFTNKTIMVDFILSYGQYLTSQGMTFDDVENGFTLSWNQMAQEFLYWANQGWAPGTMINLNPVATRLTVSKPFAIVDSIESVTPENMLLDQNRYVLPTKNLIVERYGNSFTITSTTNQTISYLNLRFTSYESMVVLNNITVFNDLIYDPLTAARQNRIYVTAATSTEWNGELNAQGFILNNPATVVQWQPHVRYTKGDIVIYKNTYWSALNIIQPADTFDYTNWAKSQYSMIDQGFLSNIANKANQLANSYNTQVANLDSDNDLLAYGLIGYRPRQYMSELGLNNVSQINLYQQFLGSKGTRLAAELFTFANLGKETGEYAIFENWGILSGTYGATANRRYFEVNLNEALLQADPSTVEIILPGQTSQANQSIYVSNIWQESYPITSTNILPTIYNAPTDVSLPSAGYVNLNDADITVFSINNPTSIEADINNVGIGTIIWVAADNPYTWNIYRCALTPATMYQLQDNLDGTSTAQFNAPHNLKVGDLIIVRYFNAGVDGVYRVLAVPSVNAINIAFSFLNTNQLSVTGVGLVFFLQTCRVTQASDVANLAYVNDLVPGAKAWVDNNGNGLWEVLEKQQPFTAFGVLEVPPIANASPVTTKLFGTSLAQSNNHTVAIIGTPGVGSDAGTIYTFRQNDNGTDFNYVNNIELLLNAAGTVGYGNSVDFANTQWGIAGASLSNSGAGYASTLYLVPGSNDVLQTQIFVAPDSDFTAINFGSAVAISLDEHWLYIGAAAGDKVYAYGRVDVETQVVRYTADGLTKTFNYNNFITINPAQPGQLNVSLDNATQTDPAEYVIINGNIEFVTTPVAGQVITIARRQAVQLIETGLATIALNQYLHTATNIYSFKVLVNGIVQRPNIDYLFDSVTTNLTFLYSLPFNSSVAINSGTYWQYINTINTYTTSGANFGATLTTTTNGRQVFIGAPMDTVNSLINAGAVYAIDRSVIRYEVTSSTQTNYAIQGSFTFPVAVLLNGTYLTNTAQFINGQFTLSGSDVIISSSVALTPGDIIEIETNQFQQLELITAAVPQSSAQFGTSVVICHFDCSVYAGAPLSSTVKIQDGLIERNANQSRLYGVTTSVIANPTLTEGNTIRVNNYVVTVPVDTTVAGMASAINAAGIPNVSAQTTADVTLVGDGVTQTFNVGPVYTQASAYNTVVYVNSVLQIASIDYSYNSTTETISFVTAPMLGSKITVVSGRLTISINNFAAGTPADKLTVLPGINGTAFNDLGFVTYAYAQTILSPNPTDYANFGSSLDVNSNAVNIVVGAPNGDVYIPMSFDDGKTYFDEHSTTFFSPIINSGVAFTYDFLPSATPSVTSPGKFVFGQQIYTTNLQTGYDFGESVNYTSGRLLVGSPTDDDNSTLVFNGQVNVFDNTTDTPAWAVIHTQQPVPDVSLINTVYSYDKLTSKVTQYFDFINPLQGKILGAASQNLDYIGSVDPAFYNQGTVHNVGASWGQEHLGEMWWDTATVRFIDPNQDNILYASTKWSQLFPGSNIDVYQWTSSSVPPAQYTGPGTVLSTTTYTVGTYLDVNNILNTRYYFWVKGITTIATTAGKTLPPSGVASYIANPKNSGIPYIAALTSSTVALYNASSLISAQDTILHIGYDAKANTDEIHTEYQFIADGKPTAFLNDTLYRKFQDSFAGADTFGNLVPDPTLNPGMRYGVQFRPRQSMFANRYSALQNYLTHVNNVLIQYPISETRSFNLLNASEPIPNPGTGAWDKKVANLTELGYQNLVLVPNGYRYLVLSDSSQNGRWTIYEVVVTSTTVNHLIVETQSLNLIRVQTYDTPLYWNYVTWYQPGYDSAQPPVIQVPYYGDLAALTLDQVPVNASVQVTSNAMGNFEIYQRTSATIWTRVGLQNGTIQFSSVLWDYVAGNFGFDTGVFDSQYFDQEPVTETRYIIRAINEELLIDELLFERNQVLVLMFNFIYSEFTAPEWLIKTSYIDVYHYIRALKPYQVYLQDNQNFVLDYLQEVKPYHVQTREFNLVYNGDDAYSGMLTDFDIPAYYDTAVEIPQFVSPILLPYTQSVSSIESTVSDAASDTQVWLEEPYTNWYNNYLLELMSVSMVNQGTGYFVAPTVEVTGNCITQATMTAVINSAGQVVGVNIINPGYGYTTTAVITFVGGTGSGAQAVALMGNNLVRSFKTTIKYDRCEYASTVVDWQANVSYTSGTQVRHANAVWSANATGSSAVFDPANWTVVTASVLNGANRTMGYYVPGPNEPGLSLPLLIDGIDYPGVQVQGVPYDENTGYDVGNFDITPFDNIAYGPEGRPTYDPGILDTVYESSYLDLYLGTRPTDINVDGGAYIDTYSSHAPEELVPGSEFDTLDLRVYTRPSADYIGDGIEQTFAAPVGSIDVVVAVNNVIISPLHYNYTGGNVNLATTPAFGDEVVVLEANPASAGMTFRIFQDMREVQATYRITPASTTTLAADVAINDDIIYVVDASALSKPDLAVNIWGVVTIQGERIMYRYRDTTLNTISGLLRGTAGTGISIHSAGNFVYDMGRGNIMPAQFQNYIVETTTLANGIQSTFTADNITLQYNNPQGYDRTLYDQGTATGEPNSYDYGLGDPTVFLEVYVGGIRALSGFTVVGTNPAVVQFTSPPPAGVDVTLLVRRGVDWYQPGIDEPSNGVALQYTDTAAAKFLRGVG